MATAMSADEFHIEQVLRNLYYDPKHGYSSEQRLYQEAKDRGLNVTRNDIGEWLKTQDTYTKFKQKRKPKKYQRVFVSNLGDQLQMDLVDMSKFSVDNNDNKWILTTIEILSRYAFAIPVHRKDTVSMRPAVKEVLNSFISHFGRKPDVVQFDEGKEFYNVGVMELLSDDKIKHFSTRSVKKASIIERFNRTLKTRMWKYFNVKNTKVWIDVLDDFVGGYNDSYHRTIKMKPKDVNKENENIVFAIQYGYGLDDIPKAKFKVNDHIRVLRYRIAGSRERGDMTFEKGYVTKFTDEIFTVTRVIRGDPNMYDIEDHNGKKIVGKFYESEMSAYNK